MKPFRYEQSCALARSAEILGERWTLLIIRDLLLGPRRFTDLRQSLEGVTPSVLTERLDAMQAIGLIRRERSGRSARSYVYALTADGLALRQAVFELIRWGARFLLPLRSGDQTTPSWVLLALMACARRSSSPTITWDVVIVRGAERAEASVSGGPQGTQVSPGLASAPRRIEATPATLLGLMAGLVETRHGAAPGLVVEGDDPGQSRAFSELFEVSLRGQR